MPSTELKRISTMTRLKKLPPKATNKKSKSNPPVAKRSDENKANEYAKLTLSPIAQNTTVVQAFNAYGGNSALQLVPVLNQLDAEVKRVNSNDLTRAEAMLISQAHSLEAIFCTMSRLAIKSDLLNTVEVYMRLALRAQSQARATLETLANIKNPAPVAFVRQANISAGAQQVNNATAIPAMGSHAGENENARIELIKDTHGQGLDTATNREAIGANQTMAAVEVLHGPTNPRR